MRINVSTSMPRRRSRLGARFPMFCFPSYLPTGILQKSSMLFLQERHHHVWDAHMKPSRQLQYNNNHTRALSPPELDLR